MKKLLLMFGLFALVFGAIGCSDDDDPVGPTPPDNTATSTWNATNGYWESQVDGSSADNFMAFSFTTQDTVTGAAKVAAGTWDIAFRREAIKLNGGSSATDGSVTGYNLGAVDFAGVTINDTVGITWGEDYIDYFIDEWYNYNPQTHALSANRYVWSMTDATGNHFVKFQIDSMVGASMPPDMGTIYMKYYYNSTAGDPNLNGAGVEVNFPTGMTPVYFDFSAGAVVTPANPMSSTDWDLKLYSYDIAQNSGPNGPGECAAFYAWGELTDPTDFAGFLTQPGGAPMFGDIPGSVLTEWYNYNGQTHQLTSKSDVYLINTGTAVYKMRIESYYASIGGVPASAHYTFVWAEL
jgi:hypothetical protein